MPSPSDRREQPRSPASGPVELTFENPLPAIVSAELIEISQRGFRAAHYSVALVPGLEVQYSIGGACGRARVIWTHVHGPERLSGFLVL